MCVERKVALASGNGIKVCDSAVEQKHRGKSVWMADVFAYAPFVVRCEYSFSKVIGVRHAETGTYYGSKQGGGTVWVFWFMGYTHRIGGDEACLF